MRCWIRRVGSPKKAKGESLKLYVVFQPFLVFFKVLLLPMNQINTKFVKIVERSDLNERTVKV